MSLKRPDIIVRVVCCMLFTAATSVGFAQSTAPQDAPVASQAGASVTLADIDAFAERIPPNERAAVFDNPKRIEAVILNLLMQKQLAAEARQSGLAKDPKVQKEVDLAVDEALSKARIQQLRDDVKMPDFGELAREEYLGHKEKYAIKGKLDVKHVLISDSSRSDEEAKKLADTVEKEARAHPDQFGDLVEKYSDDPSKSQNQGLMTNVGSGRYAQAFVEAAKALKKPGEISPVIKTQYGYHVLMLVDKTPDQQRTFDQVKPQIIAQLESDYVNKELQKHTDGLRNQHLDANPDLVASLRTRYGSASLSTSPDAAPSP